jgi:hypothetical protein
MYWVATAGTSGDWTLSIDNEARDGACLELTGLRVVADGAVQSVATPGGRSSGQTKGSIGPIDRTDSCVGAIAKLRVPSDPTRRSDIIEVTDGSTTLRAELPNVLSETTWVKPPPRRVRPGEKFEVRIAPALARGTEKYDPSNYISVSLFGTTGPDLKLTSRVLPGEDVVEITVPSSAQALDRGRLILVSDQKEVAARACTAQRCVTSSRVVIEARVDIVP